MFPQVTKGHLFLALTDHEMNDDQRLEYDLPFQPVALAEVHWRLRGGKPTVHVWSLTRLFSARNTSAMPASPAWVAMRMCSTYFDFGAASLTFVAPCCLQSAPGQSSAALLLPIQSSFPLRRAANRTEKTCLHRFLKRGSHSSALGGFNDFTSTSEVVDFPHLGYYRPVELATTRPLSPVLQIPPYCYSGTVEMCFARLFVGAMLRTRLPMRCVGAD